jgi:hypothetical protein
MMHLHGEGTLHTSTPLTLNLGPKWAKDRKHEPPLLSLVTNTAASTECEPDGVSLTM